MGKCYRHWANAIKLFKVHFTLLSCKLQCFPANKGYANDCGRLEPTTVEVIDSYQHSSLLQNGIKHI
jgi:hypothetical protein